MNDIKVQKNEKLNKDIMLSKDNFNNIFEHNIKYYDKDDINSEKKDKDDTLKSEIIISEEIPFDNIIYENYINYCKNNRFHVRNKGKS